MSLSYSTNAAARARVSESDELSSDQEIRKKAGERRPYDPPKRRGW